MGRGLLGVYVHDSYLYVHAAHVHVQAGYGMCHSLILLVPCHCISMLYVLDIPIAFFILILSVFFILLQYIIIY